MIAYALILFAVAVLFLIIGILIYRGRTDLIHDYHQTNVKESSKKAYGKAFGKAMLGLSLTMTASGIIALCGETKAIAIASTTVLFIGLTASLVVIGIIQKKYNGGLF